MATSKLIFTRYLYNKDEVKLALFVAILKKQEQKSLFWAYELYYSGFEAELFDFLQKIYMDCFYTLNPAFHKYFQKKLREWTETRLETVPAAIIKNMVIRPCTLDFLLLKHITSHFEIELELDEEKEKELDEEDINKNSFLTAWLQEKKYLFIAEYVLNRCKTTEKTLHTIISYFKEKGIVSSEKFLKKDNKLSQNDITLLTTMLLFSMQENKVVNKKVYITVKEEQIKRFQTLRVHDGLKNYKLLRKVYEYGIDEDNYLSLFSSKRDDQLRENFFYNWEYYASFSPIWASRIQEYGGEINHETKKVIFDEGEDDEHQQQCEDFYLHFNYEPDEQSLEIQNKSIQPIVCKRTWRDFYEEYKDTGIFEPDLEFLEEFDRMEYI
uniref:Uncharacterized protein n=1 Tax=viral metagenome TaxID=1070528 RepID=A0A6C0B0G1_9ZZZZ